VYLRGQFFGERVKMMDWRSDFLDKLMGQNSAAA